MTFDTITVSYKTNIVHKSLTGSAKSGFSLGIDSFFATAAILLNLI